MQRAIEIGICALAGVLFCTDILPVLISTISHIFGSSF